MLPYNRKMFADELDELGIYWLDKLPDVSFEDTLRSCLTHKAYGQQPGHASFYYPKKYGYGELWLRMAQEIEGHVKYGTDVIELDLNHSRIRMADGEYCEAEKIITTIPWNSYQHITGLPEDLQNGVKMLKHSSIETRYISGYLQTDAQWLYIPDEQKPFHRILVRHNFCQGSRGYWLETRKERVPMYQEQAVFTYMNEYAYPLNTINKPQIMKRLLAKSIDGVYDSDPKQNPDAKKYDEVTIDEVIEKNLQVVDMTASILARDNKMPMWVFGLNEENSIVNTMSGKFNGTKVLV